MSRQKINFFYVMNRTLKTLAPGATLLALVLGILATHTAQGREPYLPLIGPPPLRFEIPVANTPAIMAKLALPQPQSEDATNSAPEKKEISAPMAPAPLIPMPPVSMNDRGTVIDTAAGAPPAVNPASYMLNMVPQMINQYFTPNLSGGVMVGPNGYQQGDSVLVPAELGFVPPLPMPESRSVYKSQ
jgi:hypothetical protein